MESAASGNPGSAFLAPQLMVLFGRKNLKVKVVFKGRFFYNFHHHSPNGSGHSLLDFYA
jgi:hypothetical protein